MRLLLRGGAGIGPHHRRELVHRCLNSSSDELSRVANERIAALLAQQRRRKPLLPTAHKEPVDISIRGVHVKDDFTDPDSCAVLCRLLQQSELASLYSSPGERIISADSRRTLDAVVGETVTLKLEGLRERLRAHVQDAVGSGARLFEAGAIVSWLTPPGPGLQAASAAQGAYVYWNAHCDKANNFDYDHSVLLYLNTGGGVDFDGGDLVFMDDGVDYHLTPRAGRCVLFDSTEDNIHRVQPVASGHRFLFSAWYSRRPI